MSREVNAIRYVLPAEKCVQKMSFGSDSQSTVERISPLVNILPGAFSRVGGASAFSVKSPGLAFSLVPTAIR